MTPVSLLEADHLALSIASGDFSFRHPVWGPLTYRRDLFQAVDVFRWPAPLYSTPQGTP